MYFLIEACQHPDILRVIYFGRLFLDIIFTILPIALIVMLMIDFSKAVVLSDDNNKSTKLVGKRIIYCILAFITPWVIEVFMLFLTRLGFAVNYIDRWNNANSTDIAYYQKIKDELDASRLEERIAYWEENYEKSKNNSGSASSESSLNDAADALIELARGEIGHVGGSKYSGLDDSVPWCAYFVIWALEHTKIDNGNSILDVIEKEGSVVSKGVAGGTMLNFDKATNLEFHYSKFYGGNYTPKRGDIIYFRWGAPDWDKKINGSMYDQVSHVGIVDYVEDSGVIHTIEGNYGSGGSASNKVGTRPNFSVINSSIMGYGSWYKEKRSPSGGSGNWEMEIN